MTLHIVMLRYSICYFIVYICRSAVYGQTFGTCERDYNESSVEIDLWGCGLESFDEIFPKATKVTLAGNQLKEVPSVLAKYPQLTSLDVGVNEITTFSSTLQLPALEWLIIHNNPLTSFEANVENLPNLSYITLTRTLITSVPGSISTFTKLGALFIENNAIETIDIQLPPTITDLWLRSNNFTTIPEEIFKLKNLNYLYLQGNPFEPLVLTQSQYSFLTSTITKLWMTPPQVEPTCTSKQTGKILWFSDEPEDTEYSTTVCVEIPSVLNSSITQEPTQEPTQTRSNKPTQTPIEEPTEAFNQQHVPAPPINETATVSIVTESDNESNTPYVVVTVVTSGLLLGIFILFFIYRKVNRQNHLEDVDGTEDGTHDLYSDLRVSENGFGSSITIKPFANKSVINGSSEVLQNSIVTPDRSSWHFYNNLQVYRLDLNNFEDVKRIGVGGFAIVWLVKDRNEQHFAAKRLRTDDLETFSDTQLTAFSQEIEICSMLKHANIVEFIGVGWDGSLDERNLQMFFEYMAGGDLKDCLSLTKKPDISESEIILSHGWSTSKLAIARDIAAALVYVHSFRPPVVHRDLKARNILLSGDFTAAKLGDFGVSRIRSQNMTTMTSNVGTGRWLAPEVMNGVTNYTELCDVFSFGIVLMEIETHELPYSRLRTTDNQPMLEITILCKVATGELNPLKCFARDERGGGHKGIYNLAKQCLANDPYQRPSAIQVLNCLQDLLQQSRLATTKA